jgi:predicted PurR-regulated permease PerM
MNPPEYPTPWQKKSIWAALTTLAVVAIGATAVGLIWLFSSVISFLQPFLIPFALAGVLAYLFEPVVAKIVSLGTSRKRAVLAVFAVVTLALTGILIWIIPAIWTQSGNLVRRVPVFDQRVLVMIGDLNGWFEEKFGFHVIPQISKKIENPLTPAEEATPATPPESSATPSATPEAKPPATPAPPSTAAPATPTANPSAMPAAPPAKGIESAPPAIFDLQGFLQGDWLRTTVPVLWRNVWAFLANSFGGFRFLLSMIIIPVYLYYFLIESKNIADSWSDYLPLRASAFKDEVIATLEEINGYLIAFFRGQLLVSMINGTVTGILLVICGLEGGMLIGLMLCFLGIIPYLGIILCWVPAVLIAIMQGGSGTWIPGDHWFIFPSVVTLIFFLVQQFDGFFVTPKIVGESVGLHPMTVIVSVFVWSLLLGILLGAILAVPLTATLKVVLRRYIWERRLRGEDPPVVTEETITVRETQITSKTEALPAK